MWGKLLDTLRSAVLSVLRYSGLVAAFVTFLMTAWSLYSGAVSSFLSIAWDVLPENMQSDLVPYLTYLEYANAWMPLKEGLDMLLAFWTFQLAFITVKLTGRIFVPLFFK